MDRRGREFIFIFNEHSELWEKKKEPIKDSNKNQKRLQDFPDPA